MCSKPSLVLVLVLLAAARSWAADVTAMRLDGVTVNGALDRWTNEQVTIATPGGPQSIALDQLLSLRWLPAPAPLPATEAKPRFVELVDGSRLPIDDYRAVDGKATVMLAAAAAMPDQKELSFPTQQVAFVRLQPISAKVAGQWDEIRDLKLPSDVLIVTKREGQALDYAEGVLGNVASDKIDFQLDGQTSRIDRAQAAGLIYFRRARQPVGEPRCIVEGRSGLRAAVSQVALVEGTLRIKTISGLDLAWPLSDIYFADFSAGKLVYLSDLQPASERWTPLVGLPASAATAATYGRPRHDQSAFGRPLSLWYPEEAASGSIGHERAFAKGLALRSRTEMVYRLPAGYRRLSAVAGIEPTTNSVGKVSLTVQCDDRVLLQREIVGEEAPLAIDLDVAGVRRLTISVDYGRNLDTGDWLNLCDARIVK